MCRDRPKQPGNPCYLLVVGKGRKAQKSAIFEEARIARLSLTWQSPRAGFQPYNTNRGRRGLRAKIAFVSESCNRDLSVPITPPVDFAKGWRPVDGDVDALL